MKKMSVFLLCSILSVQLLQTSDVNLRKALKLAAKLPAKQIDPQIQQLLNAQHDSNGVIEVPVLQQGFSDGWPSVKLGAGLTWNDVKAADGGNCGYHSLKNIILLMNAFEKNNANALKGLKDKTIFFDFMSIWAPMIFQKYPDYQGGEPDVSWIGGQHLDYLKNNLQNLKLKPQLKNLDMFQNDILITEDVRGVGVAAALPVNETMLMSISAFAQKQNGMLGVVWTAGHGGHWVGFVVHKQQGAIKIYYMNSGGPSPNFVQVKQLFTMSVQEIDNKIRENQQQKMREDLARMEEHLNILQGKRVTGKTMYPTYVGCVQRDGSMKASFTKQNLLDAINTHILSDQEIEAYLKVINDAWQNYLKKQIADKEQQFRQAYVTNITQNKMRTYGFWIDHTKKTGFALNLDVATCAEADTKYQATGLLVDDRHQVSFFRANEAIDTMFSHMLVGWKDHGAWSDSVKNRVVNVLRGVIDYLKSNTNVYKSINWTQFGAGATLQHFSGGFEQVIETILGKIGDLQGFDAKSIKDDVNGLMKK